MSEPVGRGASWASRDRGFKRSKFLEACAIMFHDAVTKSYSNFLFFSFSSFGAASERGIKSVRDIAITYERAGTRTVTEVDYAIYGSLNREKKSRTCPSSEHRGVSNYQLR